MAEIDGSSSKGKENPWVTLKQVEEEVGYLKCFFTVSLTNSKQVFFMEFYSFITSVLKEKFLPRWIGKILQLNKVNFRIKYYYWE